MTSGFIRRAIPGGLLCALRFLLGLVFLHASFGKILDPKTFAENLMVYQIFDSPQLVRYVAVTLPWVEWFCGVFLVLGIFVRSTSALTSCLLVAFLAGMASAMARGLEIQCGCFGSPQENVGPVSLSRDTLFLLTSLAVLLYRPDPFTLRSYLWNRKAVKVSSPAEL